LGIRKGTFSILAFLPKKSTSLIFKTGAKPFFRMAQTKAQRSAAGKKAARTRKRKAAAKKGSKSKRRR
jgi:hypothetical protein